MSSRTQRGIRPHDPNQAQRILSEQRTGLPKRLQHLPQDEAISRLVVEKAAIALALRDLIAGCDVERNEDGGWVSARPANRFRDALREARARLKEETGR